jgi:predicted CopG family antitoxin
MVDQQKIKKKNSLSKTINSLTKKQKDTFEVLGRDFYAQMTIYRSEKNIEKT